MVAVPLPLPPPPITRPGGWDPSRPDPLGGPTIGQVWDRLKEALGVRPDSQVEPRVEPREADCAQTLNQNQCNSCKLAQGVQMPATYTIPLRQYRDFDYQLRIANLRAGPERFRYTYGGSDFDRARLRLLGGKNTITLDEWQHGPLRFDGFWRPSCTAVEAKAHYKQFLTRTGDLQPWVQLHPPTVFDAWLRQVATQQAHIDQLGSPAKLEWHFLEAQCFTAARNLFGPYGRVCRLTE
ncbi:Tox-REase-5 domain-containing protein [Xanthomonas maliensis]|uniref:Tox-REase-5 domain-containing protein n=1 Tax=Xanthomonas maliensis TaxID=1321368 RepID=UPI00126497ED|nr:Tox-REase-5 domain-containing protein [Xanthomonas maliensis]KAB7765648.1 hypothetical protein CKY51_15150 [Xanthomonas maliensis]